MENIPPSQPQIGYAVSFSNFYQFLDFGFWILEFVSPREALLRPSLRGFVFFVVYTPPYIVD